MLVCIDRNNPWIRMTIDSWAPNMNIYRNHLSCSTAHKTRSPPKKQHTKRYQKSKAIRELCRSMHGKQSMEKRTTHEWYCKWKLSSSNNHQVESTKSIWIWIKVDFRRDCLHEQHWSQPHYGTFALTRIQTESAQVKADSANVLIMNDSISALKILKIA